MLRAVKVVAAAASAAALALAGCSSEDEPEIGVVETVSGFAGTLAADEPRAALVGRDILGNNGNAADAAVAMAFTMAVTMPSRVGLGGGGACVMHRQKTKASEALLFLPRPGARGAPVPALARGMAALHARYGLREWAQLVAPAEQLARFGNQVSRAFRTDLAAGVGRLDRDAKAEFLRQDGDLPAVGDTVRQLALSTTLAGLRQQGAGYLYTGGVPERLAEGAQQAGVQLTVADLRDYRPAFVDSLKLDFGNHTLHLPPPPAMGGLAAAQAYAMAEELGFDDAGTADDAHRLLAAWTRALSERRAYLDTPAADRPDPAALLADAHIEARVDDVAADAATPASRLVPPPRALAEDAKTAGFAVADRFGNMVACGFTMNGLFGSGRRAGNTGLLLAGRQPVEAAGAGLAPALIANANTGSSYFAASAAGGPAGQIALVGLLPGLDIGYDNANLSALVNAARLHHPGEPDTVLAEPDVAADVLSGLRRRGYRVEREAGLGRIQAVYCPGGARETPEACTAAADPRGHGLAVRAE